MSSITVFREIWNDRQGKTASDGTRTYKRSFIVETDDAQISGDQIRFYVACPKPGDVYISSAGAFDPWAFCTDITIDPGGSPRHWKVVASYTTASKSSPGTSPSGAPGQSPGGADRQDNPLLRPPEVSFGSREYQEVVREDVDGLAIKNSAGAPFDPPPEKPKAILTMTVSRHFATINPLSIEIYEDAINSVDWLIFPARTVRCARLTAAGVFEAGYYFWKTTGEFEYKSAGWRRRIMDAGWYYLVGGNKTLFMDKFGRPLSTPGLLDGAGGKLADGAAANYLSFKFHPEQDFRQINFFGELGS